MEVPRQGVESELQIPSYTTATQCGIGAVCHLYHSWWQCQILNPLSRAKDQIRIFMDMSQVCNPLSHNRNLLSSSYTDDCEILDFSKTQANQQDENTDLKEYVERKVRGFNQI